MQEELLKKELAATIRLYNSKGWSPATSTNYSFKNELGQIWVSRSGVDKSQFTENDFIWVNENGLPQGEFATLKPSAETLIHSIIYHLFPETKVILHSHSLYPVLLSTIFKSELKFEGYEVQKGFDGQTTHDETIRIAVLENSQDMNFFKNELNYAKEAIDNHCFVIRKHGAYAWGKNLFEAKRHLETLDYLCECEWNLIKK